MRRPWGCYLGLLLTSAAVVSTTIVHFARLNETTKDFYDVETERYVEEHVKRIAYNKVHIVEGEADGGGERVGGGERRAGGTLSLNEDDEAGDAPGGVGFGAGLDAGGDVTRARAAPTNQISRRLHAVAATSARRHRA